MGVGVVGVGVLGGPHDGRTFRHRQLAHVLIEKHIGSRLNSGAVLRKARQVEVGLDDLLLGIIFFHVQRPENLPELSGPALRTVHGTVIGDIAHHLLGNGRGAGGGPAVKALEPYFLQHGADARLGGGQKVHAVMLPEPLVLHRHYGVQQALRHLVVVHPNAVARIGVIGAGKLGHPVIGIKDGGIFGLLHAQIQHLLVAVQCIKYPNGQDTPGYAHHHNAHQAHRSNGTQHLMAGLALAILVLIGTRFARPAGLGLLNGLIRFAVHPVPCFLKAQAATSFIPQGEGENLRRRRKSPIGRYTVLL